MFRTRAGRRATTFIALAIVIAAGLLYGFGGNKGAGTGSNATIVIVSQAITLPLDPHRSADVARRSPCVRRRRDIRSVGARVDVG